MGCGDFFKGKTEQETVRLDPMKEDWQLELGTKLSDLVKQYIPSFEPGKEYGGLSKLMTPSGFETQGLDYLQKYISGGIEPTGVMGQAQDVLSKTLGGEYDPFTSKYYESLRKNIEKERKQSISDLNKYLGKYGLGGTSYRAGRVGDIGQESFEKVSDVLAQLQEGERIRQLNAIQTAMQFRGATEGEIQKKLSTIMDIGSLPRLLEGVGYQDFMRKQQDYKGIADLANMLFQYNMPYGKKELTYDVQKPSGLSKVIDYAKLGLPIIAAPFTGGASLAAYGMPGYMTPSSGNSDIGRTMQGMGGLGDIMGIPTGGGGTFMSKLQGLFKGGTGGLNQGGLSSISGLRDMPESEFNQYWNMYS